MKASLVAIVVVLFGLSTTVQAGDSVGEPIVSGINNKRDNGPVERRVWRGEPLRVPLKIDAERILHFPGATRVRAGPIGGPVPGLRIQPLANHLYLTASQPFERTRLLVQADRRHSVLVDLSAKADAAPGAGTLEILIADTLAPAGYPDTPAGPERFPAGANTPIHASTPRRGGPVGYVALVRHAAQTLYAPERLMPPEGRILRTPLESPQAPHLVRGGRIEAAPLAAWRAAGPRGPLWVTAVRLRNLSTDGLDLDPRDLRGQWRAAAFQHGRLGPAGRESDVTTLYLVSDKAFDEAHGGVATAAVGENTP